MTLETLILDTASCRVAKGNSGCASLLVSKINVSRFGNREKLV